MTENEIKIKLEVLKDWVGDVSLTRKDMKNAIDEAIQALEEIQQYRAYKEIFESHFSKEALELLSDKEEFGKWLERGKWIAKRCDEINRDLEQYREIGTIEEFKALKEKEERFDRNIRMFNAIGLEIRNKAIDEFAEKLNKKISDFVLEHKENLDFASGISVAWNIVEEVAEQMKEEPQDTWKKQTMSRFERVE